MKHTIFLIAWYLLAFTSLGQDAKWIVYHSENSKMPLAAVTDIEFDSKGIAWIGTRGSGLVRFDGTQWTIFNEKNSPLSHYINDIYIDSANDLWVASRYVYKLHKATWENINSEIPEGIIQILPDKNGNIWMIREFSNGLYKLSKQGVTSFNPPVNLWPDKYPPPFITMTFDLDGTLWISCRDGIFSFGNNTWKYFSNQVFGGSSMEYVGTMCFDKTKNGWLGTWHAGLIKHSNNSWTRIDLLKFDPSNDFITAIAVDKKNKIFVGINDNGLIIIENEKIVQYTTNNSALLDNDINDIKFDSKGRTWLGTNKGICILEEN